MKQDKRVDAYITSLPDWQQTICVRIRNLIHQADAEIEETIKRTDRPYFVLKGNVCAFLSTKNHVNIFIYDPIAPDPEHIINQGKTNATARAIQIFQGDTFNESAFKNLIKSVAANNRAGGWRNLQKLKS